MIRDSLVRPVRRWLASSLAVCLALTAASGLAAQEPVVEGKIHVVKAGDTLWEIARIYLADPFLWPEVYRVNTAVVEDPHWIYTGEKLRIPSAGDIAIAAQAPAPDAPKPQAPTASALPPASPAPAAAAPAAGELPTTSAVPEPEVLPTFEATGPTVFAKLPHVRVGVDSRRGFYANDVPRPVVRTGEIVAAPYVARGGGPRGAGRIVGSSEIPGTGATSEHVKVRLNDRVYVRSPDGSSVNVGDRLLAYALGPELPGQGTVVVPVGVFVVESAGATPGEAVTARLAQQFGEVEIGGGVVPFERPLVPTDVQPTAVAENGFEARVSWVHEGSLLPSLQSYVVLEAADRDGVKLGDQFTIVRTARRGEDGTLQPEQRIAVVQVVRVTDRGTTAIVIDHMQPAIKVGALARVTARMP